MDLNEANKIVLVKANAAVANGDNEGFLKYCTENTKWNFLGDKVLNGKESLRNYMKENYLEPPQFEVTQFICQDNFVTAIGKITVNDKDGKPALYDYCDIWRLEDGLLAELTAFVIQSKEDN